jgi:hypothetical protein
VSHGIGGTLFANGLRDEAEEVRDIVSKLMESQHHVVVNVFGLSRGGIAAIYLAQALSGEGFSPNKLTLNMMLFDPVPGDQVLSGFPWTGRNAKDVSGCAALKRVLALYPHEPLPWISFHAPLLCRYPDTCRVDEDVILGCHQGALYATARMNRHLDAMTLACNLSCRMIVDFCGEVGTQLVPNAGEIFRYLPSREDCLQICQDALSIHYPTSRSLHDGERRGRVIVRREPGECQYLNKYHERLVQGAASPSSRYMLAIDGE